MKIMITGHRPNKLGGYSMDSAINKIVEGELRKVVSTLDPAVDIAICGMAQGVDQLFANICMEFGIPVHAYVPFEGQESKWPTIAQKKYRSLINQCDDVVVCAAHSSKGAFLFRNALMVRNSDSAIAVWDGSPGGTAHAVSLIKIAGLHCTMIEV